jgi:hypothetical protein
MSTRPDPDDLAYALLHHDSLEPQHIKLSLWGRQHLQGEVRCPKRHLLAAMVRTIHGVLVFRRVTFTGRPWGGEWLDDIANPAAIQVSCLPCRSKTWTLDLSDPAHPRLMPYDHGTTTEPRRAASNPG